MAKLALTLISDQFVHLSMIIHSADAIGFNINKVLNESRSSMDRSSRMQLLRVGTDKSIGLMPSASYANFASASEGQTNQLKLSNSNQV